MIDCVADEMNQWFAETVEDRPIELELSTDDLDLDSLAEFLRDLTSGSRQVIGHANKRRRAQFHDAPLKLRDTPIDPVEAIGHIRIMRIARHTGAKLARTENHFPYGREESVEDFGSNANGRIQCGRRDRRRGGRIR